MFCGHGAENKELGRLILENNQYVAIKAKCGDYSFINPSEMQDFFAAAEPEIKVPRISTAATAAQIPFYSFEIERDGNYSTIDTLKVYRPPRHTNTDAYLMIHTVPNVNLSPLAHVQLSPVRIQDISHLGVEMKGAIFGIWMSGIIPQTARPEFPPEIQEISRILVPYYQAGHIPDDTTHRYESIVFVPGETDKDVFKWKPFVTDAEPLLAVHFRKTLEAAFENSILPFSEYIKLVMEKRKKAAIEELTVRDLASTLFDMKWALDYISERLGGAEPFLLINPSCRSTKDRHSGALAALRAISPDQPIVQKKEGTRRRQRKSKRQTKRYRRRR